MGRRLALLIATYDYQDPGLRQLTAPAHDAEGLAAVLRDPGIAGFEVTTLINEPHYRVGEAIADLYRDRRRDDLTLLYFTGHGLKDEEGRLYLATTNTRRGSLLFSSLPAEQIDQAMSGCMSRQKVLILDCCYSGAFPAGRIAKADSDIHTLERFQGRGRTVLTASDAMQYSFEGGDRPLGEAAPQSVFTRHLVAGLRDGSADLDGDGDITIDELYSFVYDRVVDEMPQQRPKKQENVEGRIVIARNINWTLPAYLRNALASPIPTDRLAALDGLTHLHRIGNDLVREQAVAEVRRLADDDSRVVSTAALERLQALGAQVQPAPSPPPPSPPPPETPRAHAAETTAAKPAPPLRPAHLARLREDLAALRTDLLRPVRTGVRRMRSTGLTGVSGLLAFVAAGLVGYGCSRRDFPAYPLAVAAVAVSAGVCSLWPATRRLIGPGLLLGSTAASVWSLVYLTAVRSRDLPGYRFELAGHGVLLLAACLVGLVLHRDPAVRFELRLPSNRLTWWAAAFGALGTAAGVWALSGLLYDILHAQAAYGPRAVDPWTWAYLAVIVPALTVPAWAALTTPRMLGHALLAGWSVGAAAICLDLSLDFGYFSEFSDFDTHTVGVLVFAATLLLLVTVAAVMARWGVTTRRPLSPRPHRTVLIAALALAPALAVGGAIVVDNRASAPFRIVHPHFAAISGDRLYVTAAVPWSNDAATYDKRPGYVFVIDTRTNTPVGRPIPVGHDPGQVVASRDGNYVYVANTGDDTVTVISTFENTVVGSPIPIGHAPAALAVSMDDRLLLVAGAHTSGVSVIDTRTRTRSTTAAKITPGGDIEAIAFSPDARRLYVARAKSDVLSVINTATGKTVDPPITVGYHAGPMAADVHSRRLYVITSSEDSRETGVAVIDTGTGTEVAAVPLDDDVHFGIAVSGDGRRVYIPNLYLSTVSILDTQTNAAIGSPIPMDESPVYVAVSPDSSRVYVTMGGDGRIAVFKAADPHSVSTITLRAG
jgi:YVTN family beta-propeller protein